MIFEPEIYECVGGRWTRVETAAMKAVREAEALRALNEEIRARARAAGTRPLYESPLADAVMRDIRIGLAVKRPWPLFKSTGIL